MSVLSILATLFGIAGASAYLPQAYRIYKRKSSADLSIPTFSIFSTSMFIWLLYGIEINNIPLIIPNSLGVFGGVLVVSLSLYYRKKIKINN